MTSACAVAVSDIEVPNANENVLTSADTPPHDTSMSMSRMSVSLIFAVASSPSSSVRLALRYGSGAIVNTNSGASARVERPWGAGA